MSKTSSIIFHRNIMIFTFLVMIALFAAAENVVHLSPENHATEAHFTSNEGMDIESPVNVSTRQHPSWWWTWRMKTIYILVIGLAVWLCYRYVVSRIKLREKLFRQRVIQEKNEEIANAKLQFFYDLSHELLSPLQLIINPLEQLLTEKVDAEQTHYYYSQMNRNARQLLDISNQLLDFHKIQSKSLTLDFVRTDLVSCVRKVASSFDDIAAEKYIMFSVRSSADMIEVDFDTDKLERIISNLLLNAFKFTPVYGEINIHITMNDLFLEKVVVEVQDNGDGFPDEFPENVFDMFYQIPVIDRKSTIGSVIGLAMVKELVSLHHGEITVISERSKGTNFRIVLPLRQESVSIENFQQHQSKVKSSYDQAISNISSDSCDGSQPEFKDDQVSISDNTFIKKIVSTIEANIDDPEYDSELLAATLKMSRSQLYRKLKTLSNRTVHDFIISVRMKKAKELLLSGDYSISDIAYKVGFTLPTNFTRTFSKYYGMSPSKFINR